MSVPPTTTQTCQAFTELLSWQLMPDPIRLIFMGSDAICLPLLDFLKEQSSQASAPCALCGIVSQPDRPSGRGKRLQANPVAAWAKENNLPLLQPETPDAALVDWIQSERIDLGLVMAYGHLLKRALREAPKHGLLNFHASLLPALRGASPIETAVALGEKETGVCLMKIVARMDAGAVADRELVPIPPQVTSPEVRAALGDAAARLLQRRFADVLTQQLAFTEQDERAATYCRRLNKADGGLDFAAPAQSLVDRIRGLQPWPGAYFELEDTRIKVFAAQARALSEAETAAAAAPGTVLGTEDGLHIATVSGVLVIAELQRPGGKRLRAPDYLRGHAIAPGTLIPSQPMPELLKPGPGSKG